MPKYIRRPVEPVETVEAYVYNPGDFRSVVEWLRSVSPELQSIELGNKPMAILRSAAGEFSLMYPSEFQAKYMAADEPEVPA